MKLNRLLIAAVRGLFFIGLLCAGLGLAAGSFLVIHVSKDLPKLPAPLSRIIETPQSLVFGANGQILAPLGARDAVSLNMISPDFINAVVATEDHRFFEHHGVNKLRILKGLYITFFKSGRVQGASTITQQLAKNLFFSFEKTWERKFKELLVALQIEASSTKEEILEAYVNQIHFGAGAQGVETAARTFFGKSAKALDLGEAALLAGLPKSPSHYNPFRYLDRALARRKVVLQRMAAAGYITRDKAEKVAGTLPRLHKGPKDSRTGSYFLDALVKQLVAVYGEDVVFHGGIKVYSTLDPRLQNMAKTAVRDGLGRIDRLMGRKEGDAGGPQGALVAVDTASGAVKAMVGGRDYYASEFNRAVKARRQAGSGFKPFVYYAAFEKLGMHPASLLSDRPVSIPVPGAADWRPLNFEKSFRGPVVLKQALVSSINTIAAQLVAQVGPAAVIDTARTCGIKSPLNKVYSVALGTSGVTAYEMAASFSVYATLGVKHDPFLFWRVEDARGRVLFERIVKEKQVLNPALAFQVVDMMEGVINTGSGRSIRRLGFNRPAAGKTGTSNDYRDAWFTGFTPSLCTSVWTGFDRGKALRDKRGIGITGGRGAAPIWADFMKRALEGEPVRDFSPPADIRFKTVGITTGCTLAVDGNEMTQGNGLDGVVNGRTIQVAVKKGQISCSEKINDPVP